MDREETECGGSAQRSQTEQVVDVTPDANLVSVFMGPEVLFIHSDSFGVCLSVGAGEVSTFSPKSDEF